MNSGHTYLFHKGFCTVYSGAKNKNEVTLPHIEQRKHAFWGKIKEKSKTKKYATSIVPKYLDTAIVKASTKFL